MYILKQRLARCLTSKDKSGENNLLNTCVTNSHKSYLPASPTRVTGLQAARWDFGSSASSLTSTDDCLRCQWLWSGQCWKPAQFESYCCVFDFPQGCTLNIHWLNREPKRMEHVLLVGGRLGVGDVLSEFLFLTFFLVCFPPLSFCPLFFLLALKSLSVLRVKLLSTIWSANGDQLWGGVCLTSLWLIATHRPQDEFTSLSGEVREELKWVCTQTLTPFTGKSPHFLQPWVL